MLDKQADVILAQQKDQLIYEGICGWCIVKHFYLLESA